MRAHEVREPTRHFLRRTARAAARRAERDDPSVDALVVGLERGPYRYVVHYHRRESRKVRDRA